MVNGVTPSEELGEHPKDTASARDTEGALRGKRRADLSSPVGFGGWGLSSYYCALSHNLRKQVGYILPCVLTW